jgi:hypothetical protein
MNNIGSDTGKIVCEQVDTAVRSKIRNGIVNSPVFYKLCGLLSSKLSIELWNQTTSRVVSQLRISVRNL